MAEVVPSIFVNDAPSCNNSIRANSPGQGPTIDGPCGIDESRLKSTSATETRPSASGKIFPNKLIRTLSNSHGRTSVGPTTNGEGRRDSQTGIDPLSQHIFERTHPENITAQKTRLAVSSEGEAEVSEKQPYRAPSEPVTARADTFESFSKDKKKGVSFLSRFIGSKKKDTAPDLQDDESELGHTRAEGTDADVFSQPIGFIPKFPAPPKYIKVRSRGKREQDFNRVFLAQELRGRTGVEIAQAGGRAVKGASTNPLNDTKDGSAIWALEFSKDGKFLAAGGHDHLVRVWAVLSTEEDRRAHEREEVATKDGQQIRLSAPVFKAKPVQEYDGHTATVLDLSWSKNNFLLSSSMDKTVRLWHISRTECLCSFKHSDFVTSIQFHPRDDRFFLAGSLDSKLRLWSIPDKSVAYWSQLPDLITAVAFSPDGKTSIAGCLHGLCQFYDTEGLKYLTQMSVKSARGKNAKGSKVTGIHVINYPPQDPNGEVKLLITTNDSRIRVYNLRDKGLELKLKGNQNTCSQIHATFSDDAKYIICGSEDRKVYIWSTSGASDVDKEKRPVETFEGHSAIVTNAIMAPVKTRQLLQSSGDPLYELCNPPPVTLVSRTESFTSSSAPPEDGRNEIIPISTTVDSNTKSTKPEETPAYLARSCHFDGNIVVTADYLGKIKVFRQDCAHKKRLRADNWDTSSTFSKKMLNRSSSIATRNSKSSRRDSLTHPSSDRILSWRQTIERSNGSHEHFPSPRISNYRRSVSPKKSPAKGLHGHNQSLSTPVPTTPSLVSASNPPSPHKSSTDSANPPAHTKPDTHTFSLATDKPLTRSGEPAYMFYDKSTYAEQLRNTNSVHRLSSTTISNGNSVSEGRSSGDFLNLPRPGLVARGSAGSSRVSVLSSDDEGG